VLHEVRKKVSKATVVTLVTEVVIVVYMSDVKCLLFLVDCKESWISSIYYTHIIHHNIKVTKIRPPGTELFRADGRTDMTKLIVALCNFMTSLFH